ncbi:MAG: HAMP domain-containing protein [Deltaproteobacteria bacterium]|nr:MAG: HAMP domain-containing protein [Deltaproteobacteria bacterium]
MLGAFLGVTLVPLLVITAFTWWQGRALIARYLAQDTEQIARLWAVDLDDFLNQQRLVLGALSLGDDSDDTVAMMSIAVARTPSLEALLYLSPAGDVLASTRTPEDLDPWVRDACIQLAADPERVMTHAGEGHAHEVVLAMQPDGTAGVLCGLVSFTLHQQMLSERAEQIGGGLAYIIDRDGDVVCHAFEEGEPHVHRGEHIGGEIAAIAARGRSWSGRVQGSRGPSYAAFASARSLPWGVWVEIPEQVASRSLMPLMRRSATAAGVFALLVGVLGVIVSRRLVRPLVEVSAAAAEMAEGAHGSTVEVVGTDEVADLARQFNRMSRALAESHRDLDAKVEQRTRQLAAARDFSDQLLDTMRERILVLDRDRRVIRVNRAAADAWGEDIVGRAWEALLPRLGLAAEPCPLDAVLQAGCPCTAEWECSTACRSEILDVHAYPVPGDDGDAGAVIVIARDITEQRRMQARLLHQEKMAALGILSAGLAHEIGNPLASMSSELELLELAWDPERARAALPVLRDQIRRMAGLLRELVDFGRPARDSLEPTSCAAAIEQAVRLLRHDPRARGVEIETELDPDTPAAMASTDRLVQVLVNLGLNALDALEGAGHLSFSLGTDPDGDVAIEVIDDGGGMPDRVARQAFSPFFTTKPPGQGTGLGLFVSDRIIDSLGGRLAFSTRQGVGTRFTITLPGVRGGEE